MKILAKKHNELVDHRGQALSRVLTRGHDEVDQDPYEPSPEPAANVQRTMGARDKGSTHYNNRSM
jgi:hypothetical protein